MLDKLRKLLLTDNYDKCVNATCEHDDLEEIVEILQDQNIGISDVDNLVKLLNLKIKESPKQNYYLQANEQIFKIISSYLIHKNKHKLSIIPYSQDQLYLSYGNYGVVFKGNYTLENGTKIDIVFKVGNIGIFPEYRTCYNIYGKTTQFVLDYFEINKDDELCPERSDLSVLKIAVFRYFDFNWKHDIIKFTTIESERLFYKKAFENLAKIHKANYVHRDLSLANICFRLTDEEKKQRIKQGLSVDITEKDCLVNCIDFGLALPMEGDAIQDGIKQNNVGTVMYWSAGYNKNVVFYYKDDLEAFIYCCWDFYNRCHSVGNITLVSTLPWSKSRDLDDMYQIKKQIHNSLNCDEQYDKVMIISGYYVPVFIVKLLKYCITLVKNQKPDYNKVYQIINDCIL